MDIKNTEAVYNPEFLKPLCYCFKLLNKCNIIFYDNNLSKFEKYWKYVIIVPSVIFFNITLIAYVINVILEKKGVIEIAISAPLVLVFIQSLTRAFVIVSKKSKIVQIIDDLGTMWRTNELTETQLKKKSALLKKIDICQKVFYTLDVYSTWFFMLFPLAITFLDRFIFQQDSELLLPYLSYFPFDPTKTYFRYIMVYIFQVYSGLKCAYIYLGCEFLMVAICSHLITEFTLLREDLLNLRPRQDIENNELVDNGIDIKDIVKKHQKLILLSQNLDDIFNKINFIVILFTTIIVCFFAFAARVSSGAISILINCCGVVGILLPLFILCYFSELLATESLGIAEAAYANLWYEGGRSYRKSICLIIVRSQRSCCLTSLKYTPVNLTTYSKVLSTTWSYFSLISCMYEDIQ